MARVHRIHECAQGQAKKNQTPAGWSWPDCGVRTRAPESGGRDGGRECFRERDGKCDREDRASKRCAKARTLEGDLALLARVEEKSLCVERGEAIAGERDAHGEERRVLRQEHAEAQRDGCGEVRADVPQSSKRGARGESKAHSRGRWRLEAARRASGVIAGTEPRGGERSSKFSVAQRTKDGTPQLHLRD